MSDSFSTLWTVDCQIPLSMGFPRQEYWSGLPFSSPGDLPNPAIEPASPVSPPGRRRLLEAEQPQGPRDLCELAFFFLDVCFLFVSSVSGGKNRERKVEKEERKNNSVVGQEWLLGIALILPRVAGLLSNLPLFSLS